MPFTQVCTIRARDLSLTHLACLCGGRQRGRKHDILVVQIPNGTTRQRRSQITMEATSVSHQRIFLDTPVSESEQDLAEGEDQLHERASIYTKLG